MSSCGAGACANEYWSGELEKELRVWVSLPLVLATMLNPRFKAYLAIFRSLNLPSVNMMLLQVCWSQGASAETIIWSVATRGQNNRSAQLSSAGKFHTPHTHLLGKNPVCVCVCVFESVFAHVCG